MLWDGLILLAIVTLAIAGWNVGIINSWRGIFGIIIATVVTQQFYVDFATFIVQQLRMSPDYCIAIAYVLLWCGVDMLTETLMMVIIQVYKKNKPLFFERVAGAGFGLVKGILIVLLPAIALQAPITVPTAPAEHGEPLINPMESGADKSVLFPFLGGVGKGLYQNFGGLVASTKKPSFKPVWKNASES